jgi:predicted O-methyltransferase YrrM
MVGVGAAAAVYAAPDALQGPAVVGAAAFGFVLFAVRERAALRGLSAAVGRVARAEQRRSQELTAIRDQLNAHMEAAPGQGARLDRLAESVNRFHDLAKELAALDAASTAEVLARLDSTNDVLGQFRVDVDGRLSKTLDHLDGRVGEMLGGLEGRVGEMLGGLEGRVGDTLGGLDGRLSETEQALGRVRDDVLNGAGHDFRQTEALLALYSLLQVRAPLPPSRRWAASPDLLVYLVSFVLDHRPGHIVELGGGLSTLLLAYAIEKAGGGGRIISLDHDPRFAEKTRASLVEHGLDGLVEVRVAPLTVVDVGGEEWTWYDPAGMADVRSCDLLLVDGPPANTGPRARYPALPILVDRLAEQATVVLDDCVRQDEKDLLSTWQDNFPGWRVEVLDHEKGTAVLTRG